MGIDLSDAEPHAIFFSHLTLTYGFENNAIFEKPKRHDVSIRSRSKLNLTCMVIYDAEVEHF